MPQEPLKPFRWNVDKNNQLQQEREINFETIVAAVTGGRLLDTIEHPNQEKYPNQRIFIVEIDRYVYLVPFVEDASLVILAEHLGHGRIFSVDYRDFNTYRWKNTEPFQNLLQ